MVLWRHLLVLSFFAAYASACRIKTATQVQPPTPPGVPGPTTPVANCQHGVSCQLSYSVNPAQYTRDTAIASNAPVLSTGFAPTQFSVSPALPTGLTLAAATGVIAGTPSRAQIAASYTITAVATAGSTTAALSIAVNDLPPTLVFAVGSTLFLKNVAGTSGLPTVSGGAITGCVLLSGSPPLPAGLSIDAATCEISGTPVATAAQATYTLHVSFLGGSVDVNVNLTISEPPILAFPINPAPFLKNVAGTSGVPSLTGAAITGCVVKSGTTALPSGLVVSAATCEIHGTPLVSVAQTTYTLYVSSIGGSLDVALDIVVFDQPPLLTFAGDPYMFSVGVAADTGVPANSGGAVTSCLMSGSSTLPDGLTLGADCRISGTPTTAAAQATFSLVVGYFGGAVSKTVAIRIQTTPPSLSWRRNPFNFVRGTPNSTGAPVQAGSAFTNCVALTTLPAGLVVSSTNCAVSGTPTAGAPIAATAYTLRLTYLNGTVDQIVNIAIVNPTVIVTPPSVSMPASSGINVTFAGSGGTGPYTYTVIEGSGSINASTGLFTAGPYADRTLIEVSDTAGQITTAQVSQQRTWVNGAARGVTLDGNDLFLVGEFQRALPNWSKSLVALNKTTGAIDRAFDVRDAFDKEVLAAAVWSSGGKDWLIVGGKFTTYRGLSAEKIAKIDLATGALDTSFVQAGNFPYGNVNALAVVGSSLFVGGNFTATYAGQDFRGLLKLALAPGPNYGQPDTAIGEIIDNNSEVRMIVAHGANKMIVGGTFSTYRRYVANAAITNTVDCMIEIDVTTGAPSFVGGIVGCFGDPTSGPYLAALALSADQTKLYMGGRFTSIQFRNSSGAATTTAAAAQLAVIDLTQAVPALAAGFSSLGFAKGANPATIFALLPSGASSLYVGGYFATYGGASQPSLVKLTGTGAVEQHFSCPNENAEEIHALAKSGSTLFVGGTVFSYDTVATRGLIALDTTPAIPTLLAGFDNFNLFDDPSGARALVTFGNDVFAAGGFNVYGGVKRPLVAKFDLGAGASHGSLQPFIDGSLLQPPDIASVGAVVVDRVHDAVYLGGYFYAYGADPTDNLAKFTLAGAMNTSFKGLNSIVYTMTKSADALYVGGYFDGSADGSLSFPKLAKYLLATGAYDPSWNIGAGFSGANVNGSVSAVAMSGSDLYVGGAFDSYKGVAAANLLKMTNTGVVDPTFVSAGLTNNYLQMSIVPLPSGIYVGGDFTSYGTAASTGGLVKLDATGAADTGNIKGLYGGALAMVANAAGTAIYPAYSFFMYFHGSVTETLNVTNVAKINVPGGTLVPEFITGTSVNDYISAQTLSGNQLVEAGVFTKYNGVPAPYVVVLDATTGALLP